MRRIFATKEQLTADLLGELLKHINFPSKLAVAASGKDPSNCTLGSPNKVHTLRMTRRECEHGAKNVLTCFLKLHYLRNCRGRPYRLDVIYLHRQIII